MPDPRDAELAVQVPPRERRWTLIRDLLVFLVKVTLEATRDLVLIPLSLVAGLVGLFSDRERPDALFRRVLKLGRRFDEWLNLFGALGPRDAKASDREAPRVDDLFERLEAIVVEQHQRGGITASAKSSIDRALDHLQISRLGSGSRTRPPDDAS